MSRDSAWSMALVTRLRTIRSTRRTSASAEARVVRGSSTTTRVSRWSASARVMSTTRWATSTRLTSSASSTAAPASKRLISSRSASSVSNRSSSVCSSSAARAVTGSKLGPGVVQDVAGHPHGRQRRPQLVRDVGDEAALEAAELLELADLLLQVAGHLVERRRQPRQVVLAGHAQSFLQVPRGQPLGHPARHPDRGHHLAGHQPGQAGDQQQQQRPGGQQRTADEREGLALLVEGVEVVERVGVVVGRQASPGCPPRRPGPRAAPGCRGWCGWSV